jgi:hypothetical protein
MPHFENTEETWKREFESLDGGFIQKIQKICIIIIKAE